MLRFGDFELCEERREMRRAGKLVPLQPKVLDLLAFLIRHRARVVPQAELLRALWPDSIVTPQSLARALKEARRALGDDGHAQRWIRTHRGGGYRFVGDVTDAGAVALGPSYVGRSALLDALDATLARAANGAGAVAVLLGPAGIGKTRTADEVLQRAERRGFRTVLAGCAGAEDAPPLWPWRRIVATLEPDETIFAAPPAAGASAAADRFQRFAAITACVERAAARGPLCLVLDDLHEADSASLALLAHLAPELRRLPVLCVAGLRRDAFERRPELARERAQLLRCDLVTEHEVAPLDAPEVAELVAARAGARPPPSVVADLLRATQGNPLWLQELLRGGLRGAGDAAGLRWGDVVTRGFEQVLRDRWLRLTLPTRSVLEAAAVIGEESDAALLAEVAKCEVDDALAEARAEGLLDAVDPEATRHRFAHALFRHAIAAGTSEAARAMLHARAAAALERTHGGEDGVEALARHWLAAGDRGDPARAIECARRAGARAGAAHDWERAAQLLERAVALADASDQDARTRCDLLLQLARACTHLGDATGARSAGERALELARAADWSEAFAEAALACAGPPLQYRVPDLAISALLDDAFERLPERGALAARLLARRAALHVLDPDPALPAQLRRAAVESALSAGSAQVLAEVLMTPYSGIWEGIEPSRRLALVETCVARARSESDRVAEARALLLRLSECLGRGDLAAFDSDVEEIDALAAELQEPTGRYQVLLHRATRALAAGDLARCERLGEDAIALGRRAGIGGAFELFVAHLVVLRSEQGRLTELLPLGRPLLPEHPSPSARAMFLWGRAELGHEEIARRLLDDVRADLPTLGVQATAAANAAIVARSAFLLRVPDLVPALRSVLAPHLDRVVLRGTVTAHGPGAYYLALLAWLAADEAQVLPLFERALEICRRMHAPGWRARVAYDAAVWLAQVGGDSRRAADLAQQAARAAATLGMAALAPRAEALRARLAK